MDEPLEDEKKPFDAEIGQDDDQQPDPNEELMLESGNGRAWLVKVPKHLLERWSAIDAEDVHLATIRVYTESKPPKILLFLPPNQDPSKNSSTPPPSDSSRPQFAHTTSFETKGPEPDVFELDMVNGTVENQIVVAERAKDGSFGSVTAPNSRARTTIMTGRIQHECNLRPGFNENYRKQMRERRRLADTPQRTVKRIEEAGVSGGRGGINRLTGGVTAHSGGAFGDLIKTKPKPAKGEFLRMARMPRNQLLDLIFQLFRDNPRWGIKPLRERTQQPEQYLKQTLSEVAFLHRHGEHNGFWELKDNFKGDGIKGENIPGPDIGAEGIKMEGYDDMDGMDEDDEDEDEDMEEVS